MWQVADDAGATAAGATVGAAIAHHTHENNPPPTRVLAVAWFLGNTCAALLLCERVS